MSNPKLPPAQIEVADQLELRLLDLESGETKRYKSTVTDLTPTVISVAMPVDRHSPVHIDEGTEVVVAIWKDFADHLFKTRVIGREKGRVPALQLRRPPSDQVRRTPRREFFRVHTKFPGRIFVERDGETEQLAAIITDLSAGGCRLQTLTRIEADAKVNVDFDLPFTPDAVGNDRSRPMRGLPGKVKMVTSPPASARAASRRPLFFIGVEFGRLDSVARNNLLRYVAFRQREIISQLNEARDEGKPRPPQIDDLEERLKDLESELREAGQEVPAPGPAATPLAEAEPDEPDTEMADALAAAAMDELFVPAVESTPERGPEDPGLLPPLGPPSGSTVLLVEDEAPLRELLSEALRQDGHAVVMTGDGQEGLRAAAAHTVDVVITDLMMPRMNGWRFISALRERGVDRPVVIITGYMNEEGQEVLTSRDVSGFLVKPVDLEELSKVVSGAIESRRPGGRRRHILAVDDEEDVRLLVTTILAQAGYQVETASSGREALASIQRSRPALVIMDIVMPGLDGFQVVKTLRNNAGTADLPIVMLTVKASAEYVRRAMALKISGYLVKPVDAEKLLERARSIVPPVATPG